MARLVRHDATGPKRLDEDDVDDEKGDVAVCQCGLSEEFPFCDGTHRTTADETDGEVHRYVDGERRVVERVVYVDENGSENEK